MRILKTLSLVIVLALALNAGGIDVAWAADPTSPLSTVPTIPQPDLLPGPEETATQNDVQSYFLSEAIPGFISGFMGLIAGLALVGLVASGIRFMTAYGNEEGITQAKKMAIWSVVGFGITLLSYTIVSIINTLAFPEGSYDPDANQDQQTVEYSDIQ